MNQLLITSWKYFQEVISKALYIYHLNNISFSSGRKKWRCATTISKGRADSVFSVAP